MTDRRPTLHEVVGRFADYLATPGNEVWGSLHFVLEERHASDADVVSAAAYADVRRDAEGSSLAAVLLTMSRTQRLRLPRLASAELKRRRSAT